MGTYHQLVITMNFFNVVCTVHHSQLCQWTNKMHFLIFISSTIFHVHSICFEQSCRSSSGVYRSALYYTHSCVQSRKLRDCTELCVLLRNGWTCRVVRILQHIPNLHIQFVKNAPEDGSVRSETCRANM